MADIGDAIDGQLRQETDLHGAFVIACRHGRSRQVPCAGPTPASRQGASRGR
jgi:hypothetical protein